MAEEKITASSKLNAFIEKNRKALWAIFGVIIAAIIAYVVIDVCTSKAAAKGLEAIDAISYTLTKDSNKLEEVEVEARRATALNDLAEYTKKGGIVGVRANMLCADLEYQTKNYQAALDYWKATADKGKKSYTAPIAYYNIASCYEALNDADNAAEYYKKAAEFEDFILYLHAKFSYGRVLETKGDYAAAAEVYAQMNDFNPDDTWAKLAKTRLLKLQIEGKAE